MTVYCTAGKKKGWPLDGLKDRGRLDCLEWNGVKSDWTTEIKMGIERVW